jgi:MoaA/NifB/PqqE/SkfB family radical SAM enzyme
MSRLIQGRRAKVLALSALRVLGMRHLVIRMDTTTRCNLRCRMCYLQHENSARAAQEMDASLFDKIAKDVFHRTRFLYLGCAYEPLMNKNCAAFLDRIGQYKLPFTSMCTNGVLLDQNIIDAAIRARLTQIVISINAATAQTYELLRPGAQIETLLEHMDLLRRRKAEARSAFPAVVTSFTCMTCNLHELPEFVNLSARHGASEVYVRHVLDFGDDDPDLTFKSQSSYRKEFDSVAREAQAAADRQGVGLFLPASLHEVAARIEGPRKSPANPYCLMPWCEFIIKPGGEVRLCSAIPPLGQLRTQTFDEICRGPAVQKLRHDLLHSSPQACSWNCREEAYDAVPERKEP